MTSSAVGLEICLRIVWRIKLINYFKYFLYIAYSHQHSKPWTRTDNDSRTEEIIIDVVICVSRKHIDSFTLFISFLSLRCTVTLVRFRFFFPQFGQLGDMEYLCLSSMTDHLIDFVCLLNSVFDCVEIRLLLFFGYKYQGLTVNRWAMSKDTFPTICSCSYFSPFVSRNFSTT